MVGWLTTLETFSNSGGLWSMEVRLEMGTEAHKTPEFPNLLLKSEPRGERTREGTVVFY